MKGASTTFHGGLNSLHLGIVNQSEVKFTAGVVGTTSEIRCHRSQNQHTDRHNTDNSSSSSSSSSNRGNNTSNASYHRVLDASEETDELILTAKGCHRFRMLEDPKYVRGVLIGKVVILGENIPKFHRGEASSGPCPSWVRSTRTCVYLLGE